MQNSPRRGVSYPSLDRSDRPDVPAHILNLVNALEVDVIFAQGTAATRAAAAHMSGVVWRETDTGLFFWDTGAIWVPLGTMIKDDLYANRPLANSLPNGARFFATDTGGLFVTNGAAWSLIGHHAFLKTAAEFGAAPYNAPYDGMEVKILVDAAKGTIWWMRYNAGSANANKWEFVGGNPLTSSVAAAEATASTSYVSLTTPGPQLTIPRGGVYNVRFEVQTGGNGAPGTGLFVSFAIGAAAAVDADGFQDAGGSITRIGRETLDKAVAASDVVGLKYKSGTGASFTFSNRMLKITPLRIS